MANTKFKIWYNNLPAITQADFRNNIMAQCEWGKALFYRKLKGLSKVTAPEQLVINKIAGQVLDYSADVNQFANEIGLVK